jgi:hypothetical protein
MKNEPLFAEVVRKRKKVYLPPRFLPRVVCDRALLLVVTLLLPDFLLLLMVLLLPTDALLRLKVLLAVLLAAFRLPLMLRLREPGFFLRVAVVFNPAVLDPALRAPLRSSISLI